MTHNLVFIWYSDIWTNDLFPKKKNKELGLALLLLSILLLKQNEDSLSQY